MFLSLIELIGTILFLLLGVVSFSKRILKPKTLVFTNSIGLVANSLYGVIAFVNHLYYMFGLEVVFSLMCLGCIFRFYALYRKDLPKKIKPCPKIKSCEKATDSGSVCKYFWEKCQYFEKKSQKK